MNTQIYDFFNYYSLLAKMAVSRLCFPPLTQIMQPQASAQPALISTHSGSIFVRLFVHFAGMFRSSFVSSYL